MVQGIQSGDETVGADVDSHFTGARRNQPIGFGGPFVTGKCLEDRTFHDPVTFDATHRARQRKNSRRRLIACFLFQLVRNLSYLVGLLYKDESARRTLFHCQFKQG